jgi:hypothetical protein
MVVDSSLSRDMSIYVSIYVSAVLLLDLGRFFSFLILYTVGRTPWKGDEPIARPSPTHRTTQTQNKCTQTSMPQMGFEPTIPAFERAKTVHVSDRAATLIGSPRTSLCLFSSAKSFIPTFWTTQFLLFIFSYIQHVLYMRQYCDRIDLKVLTVLHFSSATECEIVVFGLPHICPSACLCLYMRLATT